MPPIVLGGDIFAMSLPEVAIFLGVPMSFAARSSKQARAAPCSSREHGRVVSLAVFVRCSGRRP